MSLNFKPKSEKEISEQMLAPEGDYDFEVLSSEAQVSKKGNPMIKIKIGIYRGDTMANHVFDYLLTSMEHKLRHFCDTTGLLAKYESGTLSADDCAGRAGRVRLIVEQDEAQKYPAKNVVKDYILRTAKPLSAATKQSTPEDDDVPF
jgi:hypothetical protein